MDATEDIESSIHLVQFKLSTNPVSGKDPLVKILHFAVDNTRNWSIFVLGKEVKSCTALQHLPQKLDGKAAKQVLNEVEHLYVCPGNSDENYVHMAKKKHGTLTDTKEDKIAFLDESIENPIRGMEAHFM